jgi:hypothetical protein
MSGGYDLGGSAVVDAWDIAGQAKLEVFYITGTATMLLGPPYAPPVTARSFPLSRQPRMHRTPYLRKASRSGHGVVSVAGDIPHAVLHPDMGKRLRRVEIVVHTPDEKPKPSYVKRRWE